MPGVFSLIFMVSGMSFCSGSVFFDWDNWDNWDTVDFIRFFCPIHAPTNWDNWDTHF